MTTKLNLIKSALRESIEISSKSTPPPWRTEAANALIYCRKWVIGSMECHEMLDEDSCIVPYDEAKANATFIARARTMTPLACKELLEIIELCEFVANEESLARRILKTITSEWPDV